MKKYVLSLIVALAFWGQGMNLNAQDNVIDEVVWVVGDEPILRSDVENLRLMFLSEGKRVDGDPYCVFPEQIAIQKLYLHQAALDSIEVSETQVAQYVDHSLNLMIARTGSQDRLERQFNKPLSAIREELKVTYREQLTVEQMQESLVSDVKVTPYEIRNFYNQLPVDSMPYIDTTVEIEIVTTEPTISLQETDAIKARLRDFTEQVNSGQREFSSLARMYSEDPTSAVRGGELGFAGKATYVQEFATAAFELNDPKRVSRIVETEYGYHIIQLIERRGDRINVRHILLKPKVSDEELSSAISRLDSIRTDIVDNKFTFEDAATYISHDKDTRNNKGLMVNTRSENMERNGTSRFEMSELPQEMAKIVDKMQVGDISEPFVMTNDKQRQVAAIVRLKSRTAGHTANMSDDYQVILGLVKRKKQMEILDKWVKKKQAETYINIKEGWRNCDFKLDGWVK